MGFLGLIWVHGIFWGLTFSPRDCFDFDFCPHLIIPIRLNPKYPLGIFNENVQDHNIEIWEGSQKPNVLAGFLLEPGRRDLYSAISICVPATSHEAV